MCGERRTAVVDDYLATLEHPLQSDVEWLRLEILKSNDALTEHIKWKAPSFVFEGEDRVTFLLRPAASIRLIIHRGARVRHDTANFTFVDESGLVEWVTPDRGVVTFTSSDEVKSRGDALLGLIDRWIRA
jgi:hypothetical protein